MSGGITQARAFDEQKGVTKKIGDVRSLPLFVPIAVLTVAMQYYLSALNTPTGQKVHKFYTQTAKSAQEIHEEAKRLAGWHKTSVDKPAANEESSSKAA